MIDKITEQLRIKKVGEMKKPTIIMNPDDFNTLKTELESTITGFELSDILSYSGVPIKTNNIVETGNVVVYDDCSEFNSLVACQGDGAIRGDKEKVEILQKFSKTFMENMQDIDPEINAYVNEHFWEMFDDSKIYKEKLMFEINENRL